MIKVKKLRPMFTALITTICMRKMVLLKEGL